MKEIKRLFFWGDQALATMEERMVRALSNWTAQWLGAAVSPRISVRTVDAPMDQGAWQELIGPHGSAWFRLNDRWRLARHLLADQDLHDGFDRWIDRFLPDAVSELEDSLAEALVGNVVKRQQSAPGRALALPGSGAVHARCEEFGFELVVDESVSQHVSPQPSKAPQLPRPTPLASAAMNAKVHLQLELGAIDMELSELLDLRDGDVVCLSTRLGEPLALTLDGQQVAQASLGRSGSHKAVQLWSL